MYGQLSRRYRDLEEQVERFQKYGRPKAWLDRYWFLAFLVVTLCSGIIISLLVPEEIASTLSATVTLVFLVLFALALKFLERKSRINQLDPDDWLVYYCLLVMDNLDKHRETDKELKKKVFRKGAIKAGKELLAVIQDKWIVGDFKIAKTVFGDQISDFKNNLEYRLLPSLERLDYPDLNNVNAVFYNLAVRLDAKNPSLEGLEALNKQMAVLTSWEEEIKEKKRGRVERLKASLLTRRMLRHLSVFIGIVLIGCIVYIVALGSHLASKDGAFVASTTFMGALVVAYLDYLRKEKTT